MSADRRPDPRVARLPARSVLVELPATPDDVEAAPTTLPEPAPVALWRRWAWAVAFVPTVVLVVYQRLAADRDWPVPRFLVLAATLGLLLTALLALVRYLDDRGAAALERGRRAVLDAPVQATGTFMPATRSDDGTLTVVPASGVPVARPVRVVVPAGVAGPRPGDPLAVWHAADDDAATGVLLVRYHRAWADDVLAALHPTDDDADADA